MGIIKLHTFWLTAGYRVWHLHRKYAGSGIVGDGFPVPREAERLPYISKAWGHSHGIDIDARRSGQRWILEVKGPGSRQPMRVNYFVSILGEILQRMDDPDARYSIVFPDMAQYRGLWHRLPALAKQRTGIDMVLVRVDGTIEILT